MSFTNQYHYFVPVEFQTQAFEDAVEEALREQGFQQEGQADNAYIRMGAWVRPDGRLVIYAEGDSPSRTYGWESVLNKIVADCMAACKED